MCVVVMTCHNTGRLAIGIIGFGSDWFSARIRIPRPPQNRTTFIAIPPVLSRLREHFESRQADDQLPSPVMYIFELRSNLRSKVPRHDDDEIGAVVGEPPDGMNGDVRARQKPPMLVGISIHCVRLQI
jgi:hypothetical protein